MKKVKKKNSWGGSFKYIIPSIIELIIIILLIRKIKQ